MPNELAERSFSCSWELIEITEWFDWINTELALGRAKIPLDEEQLILAISRGLRQVEAVSRLMVECPPELRGSLTKSAILYHCWLQLAEAQGLELTEMPAR